MFYKSHRPRPSVNLVRMSSRGARSPQNRSHGGMPRPLDLTEPSSCTCTKTKLSPVMLAADFCSSSQASHSVTSKACSCQRSACCLLCAAEAFLSLGCLLGAGSRPKPFFSFAPDFLHHSGNRLTFTCQKAIQAEAL